MPPGYFQNISLSSTTMTPATFSRGAGLINFALTDEHFFLSANPCECDYCNPSFIHMNALRSYPPQWSTPYMTTDVPTVANPVILPYNPGLSLITELLIMPLSSTSATYSRHAYGNACETYGCGTSQGEKRCGQCKKCDSYDFV